MTALLAAGVAALALLLAVLLVANRLGRMRARVQEAAAAIDVQLRRRHDLVPQLVASVRGAMTHERGALEQVARAREAVAADPAGTLERAAAESRLSRELRVLTVAVRAHPRLATSENVLALQEELLTTENRVAFARQHYNDVVLRLDDALRTFPGSLVGRLFRIRPVGYLDLELQDG